MTPQRIQLKRTRGWRKPEGAIVVSRPSRWGNPWKIGPETVPEEVVAEYRAAVWRATGAIRMGSKSVGETYIPSEEEIQRDLRGHDLACWCPLDEPCHADVLLEIANQ